MNSEKVRMRFYKPDQFNNDTFFLRMIEDVVRPYSRVLEAGAGAGDLFLYELKENVLEIVGVDIDPRVESNPRLHRGIRSDLTSIPYDDNYFDVVFSRYVLEHISEPQVFLNEMNRILKPGGSLLFLTPNKWHYVSLAARLTPQAFHNWYNRFRGRQDKDTFPTLYKLNSVSDLRRELSKAGFEQKELILRECCPNYLMFSWPSFLLGVVYERIVNSSNIFKGFRVNILGAFKKLN